MRKSFSGGVLCLILSIVLNAEQATSVKTRKVIHVDMDAFYASVEQRDEPRYRGRPVVVGGSPEQRGVVAAASYEARKYGIYSAMPSRIAMTRCPDLIFVRPRFDVYHAISKQIREIFFQYTDLVEPLALDEAYLDVTENKRGLPSATLIAKEIRERIFNETRLTASAGISINKFLAKTASGINKPNGMCLISPDKVEAFLEQLEIDKFYGVGEVTAQKMRAAGINCGADLKARSEADLVKHFGKMGTFYFHIVRGRDDREVVANRLRKSIGAEESYARDLSDRYEIDVALREIAETLQRRIDESSAAGRTLTLKVKYGDYQQVTRSRTQVEAITGVEVIMSLAFELLEQTEVGARNVRLLGLSISNLLGAEEPEPEPQFVQLQLTLRFD